MSRGEDVVPTPGTKRRKYLEQNVGALDVTLSPEELERLERTFPLGAASSDWYAAPAMKTMNL